MEAFERPAASADPSSPTPEAPPARAIDSADLLQGARELLIRHGVSIYKLRVMASEKLILTK